MREFIESILMSVNRDPYKDYSKELGLSVSVDKYLQSNGDEVRLLRAMEYSDNLLEMLGMGEYAYFRNIVYKREGARNILYKKQRDHTAHTVNNYLLGWYFYTYSKIVKNEINAKINIRWSIRNVKKQSRYFGDIWVYSSLLHDIGYILEGPIGIDDINVHNDQVVNSIQILNDYFRNRLWKSLGLSAAWEGKKLISDYGIKPIEFNADTTLGDVANSLRNQNALNILSEYLVEKIGSDINMQKSKEHIASEGIPEDTFELWKKHYYCFNQNSAVKRIKCIEEAFNEFWLNGIKNKNIRVLDHGCCSGLLILKLITYYYNIKAHIDLIGSTSESKKGIFRKVNRKYREMDGDVRFWWSGIVWATSAAAMHSIQQTPRPWTKQKRRIGKMKISEEPLAYLGILVDCLQEWDRFNVYPGEDRELIQSNEIFLFNRRQKVNIDYQNKIISSKVRKNLNIALNGWKDIVDVLP